MAPNASFMLWHAIYSKDYQNSHAYLKKSSTHAKVFESSRLETCTIAIFIFGFAQWLFHCDKPVRDLARSTFQGTAEVQGSLRRLRRMSPGEESRDHTSRALRASETLTLFRLLICDYVLASWCRARYFVASANSSSAAHAHD